jgi:glycosyltransferase involved in cell wall biosynthesis
MPASLALFFPAFDAAATLPWLIARADDHLAATRAAHRVIVVDDGSGDDTARVLSALAAARANLIVVRHDRHRGSGAALRTGFAVALSTGHEWIASCDTDGRLDPADVDLVVGAARADGVEMAFANSGFRAIRRDALARLAPLLQADGADIDEQLRARARDLGVRCIEVPIGHHDRR